MADSAALLAIDIASNAAAQFLNIDERDPVGLNTPPLAGRKAGFSSQLEPEHRHGLPLSRSQPLLVKQWKYLWREEFIELRNGLNVLTTGWVDDITPDGMTMWIHLSGGMGRVMIHQCDGIDVWRVESRICQNRSDPAAEKAHQT